MPTVALAGLQWPRNRIVGNRLSMWPCSLVGNVLLLEKIWCRSAYLVASGLLTNNVNSGGMKRSAAMLHRRISRVT